jgi:hypothetical protein
MTPEEDLKYLESILNAGDCTKRQERQIKREIKCLHDKKTLREAWNKLLDEMAKKLHLDVFIEWLSKKFGGLK